MAVVLGVVAALVAGPAPASQRSIVPPYPGTDSFSGVCDFRGALTTACSATGTAVRTTGVMTSDIAISSRLGLPGTGWGQTMGTFEIADVSAAPARSIRYTIHVSVDSAEVAAATSIGNGQATIVFGGIVLHGSCNRCFGFGSGRILASDLDPGPHGPYEYDLVLEMTHQDGQMVPAGPITVSLTLENDVILSLAAGSVRARASIHVTSIDVEPL